MYLLFQVLRVTLLVAGVSLLLGGMAAEPAGAETKAERRARCPYIDIPDPVMVEFVAGGQVGVVAWLDLPWSSVDPPAGCRYSVHFADQQGRIYLVENMAHYEIRPVEIEPEPPTPALPTGVENHSFGGETRD